MINPELTPITRFSGDYWFLSNFYPQPIELDGLHCPTLEHAYQSAKTNDPEQRLWVASAPGPGAAKRRGRNVTLIDNWEDVKIDTMRALLMVKFSNPRLYDKLMTTRGRSLVEGNTWGDRFWGAEWSTKQSRWVGHNWLGRLLMQIRDEEGA